MCGSENKKHQLKLNGYMLDLCCYIDINLTKICNKPLDVLAPRIKLRLYTRVECSFFVNKNNFQKFKTFLHYKILRF